MVPASARRSEGGLVPLPVRLQHHHPLTATITGVSPIIPIERTAEFRFALGGRSQRSFALEWAGGAGRFLTRSSLVPDRLEGTEGNDAALAQRGIFDWAALFFHARGPKVSIGADEMIEN